jgi:hypothetical protein
MSVAIFRLLVRGPEIPMVQMMEVRRKFFMGTISVLSLECHNILEGLERWSREVVAAIVCEMYQQRPKNGWAVVYERERKGVKGDGEKRETC